MLFKWSSSKYKGILFIVYRHLPFFVSQKILLLSKKFILSPEQSIKIQKDLNSDIVMILDECPKLSKDKNKIKKSLDISLNWAKRSKIEFGFNPEKVRDRVVLDVTSMIE